MPTHDPVPGKPGGRRNAAPKIPTPKIPFAEVPNAIRYGKDGRARRCYSPRDGRWSDRRERLFLEALAASGNVKWSAEAVGVADYTVYRHRRQRPDFANKWMAALDQAYSQLEFELVAAARASLSNVEFPAELKIKPMAAADAIRVLSVYKASLGRGGRMAGVEPLPREMEELRESILKKVRAIRAARKKG